jgi:endonuclease/exonuclease/phosphatase (EEP) superfamily protein YafD
VPITVDDRDHAPIMSPITRAVRARVNGTFAPPQVSSDDSVRAPGRIVSVHAASDRSLAARVPTALLFSGVVAAHVALGILFAARRGPADISPVVAALDWGVAGLIAAVLWVRLTPRVTGPTIAILIDSLPMFAVAGVVVIVAAVLESQWVLALEAAILSVLVMLMLAPRARRDPQPGWADAAPCVRITVANVFSSNRSPARAAASLLESDADVIIVNEASPRFVECLDVVGATRRYPFRLIDMEESEDYRVAILSRRAFLQSDVVTVGPLRAARAVIDLDGTSLTIVGVHLRTALERGGHARWLAEVATLRELAATLERPAVIGGDFNATFGRRELAAVLQEGWRDTHDTLGRGLQPSLRAAASGPLHPLFTVLRVDHLLASEGVTPLDVQHVEADGSDHRPFVATLAVEPEGNRME